MRVLLVANPSSRGGAASRRIPEVVRALARRAEVEVLPTTDDTAAAVAERLHAASWDRVVALGGDGTFARVADGVLDAGAQVPLALLPAGLANNHARGLCIPTIYDGLEAAVAGVFAEGRLRMDVGTLQGDGKVRFYDTVGFGFQASALGRREHLRGVPGLGGELGYVLATGLQLLGRHRFGASVRVDGRAELGSAVLDVPGVLDVIVSNSVWYGGRWVLDRRARPDDGLLELVAVRGWRDLLWHGWSDREPGGQADDRGASIELAFDRQVPSQVDGEVGPTGRRFRIALQAGALAVVRHDGEGGV
jgi:diacylglycerol kinase family enzyme